ncbi:unnamed protein product [Acanthoscelides obtectus]|uniref:THAP-type domain-containing protein n=1 Tax=Acanthoscelides obtectus TaxID=200917 RepID=A0A9P0KVF9_ACAOB|nr:unnamed protein product [Acanthoscelides obtectus]CAK1623246.1 hypothetical protein AOBTE_LOCUS1909 [Acanthoscelides obtectus]
MVRQKYFLYKVEAGKAGSEGISFHRLPANEKQREKWISFLELTELEPQSHKVVIICSEHFFPQDFITDASGRTWLKPGAVPKPIWPVVSSQWKMFVGDLTSSDFSTPEKRKRNFRLMKDTILRQRKLLQNKQRLIRYFKNSIQTQKQFLDMLNQRFNMNASTESELKLREKQTKTTIGQLSNNKRT